MSIVCCRVTWRRTLYNIRISLSLKHTLTPSLSLSLSSSKCEGDRQGWQYWFGVLNIIDLTFLSFKFCIFCVFVIFFFIVDERNERVVLNSECTFSLTSLNTLMYLSRFDTEQIVRVRPWQKLFADVIVSRSQYRNRVCRGGGNINALLMCA